MRMTRSVSGVFSMVTLIAVIVGFAGCSNEAARDAGTIDLPRPSQNVSYMKTSQKGGKTIRPGSNSH